MPEESRKWIVLLMFIVVLLDLVGLFRGSL